METLNYGGVNVPFKKLWDVCNDKYTAQKVLEEPNVEVRRVLMEFYGLAKLLYECDSETIDDNERFGKIVRLTISPEEVLQAVIVTNRTKEPGWKLGGPAVEMVTEDGYKTYVLIIPNEMERAKQAVAWSFGLEEDEYNPIIET